MEVTQKQFNQKKPDQLVYLELGSGNGGMLLSVSEEGFRFRAVSPLRPNGLMPFAFSLDGRQRLQGIGEVEWLEDDGKSGGMRFVEVSPDFRSALHRWLVLEPACARSGREVSRTAAAPSESMEKIREELRRGYPQPHAKPSPPDESPVPPAGSSPEPRPARPAPETRAPGRPEVERNQTAAQRPEPTAEKKQGEPKSPAAAAHDDKSRQPSRPKVERKVPQDAQSRPFYPPPFTRPAGLESPAVSEKAGSEFRSRPAEPSSSHPVSRSSDTASPHDPLASSEPSWSREEANAAAETLRRPFRGESRSTPSDRPYIPPPVDESFENAWERAKLTAPPESPHLSRAAAGSIIGIALAVILGALAFNFRQDIGELVIRLGNEISGRQPLAEPSSPAPADTRSETQPVTGGSEQPSSPAKPDTASDTTGPATSPAANPGDSRGAVAHDVPSGPRDSSSTARDSKPARATSPASQPAETANRASGVAPPASGTPQNPVNGLPIGTETGSGQDEFNAAREVLKGDHRHRDLSKAVDLLWAGVRKGYVPAEVTLADLYRRGDGVEKNCDQAQVLLVAASKKGSPEARQMLELMAEQGCGE